MSSILEGSAVRPPELARHSAAWEAKLKDIERRVRRRALTLYTLGMLVYGGGTAAILLVVHDRGLALVLQMFLFQLILMYFGVNEMYTNLRGAFLTSIEQSRDTMPVFEDLAKAAQRLNEAVDKMGDDPSGRMERKMEEFVKRIEAKADKIAGSAEKFAPDVDAQQTFAAAAERLRLPMAGAHHGRGDGNGDQHEGSAT